MSSDHLGDRLPPLVVLLDRKIEKPDYTESPSCENPAERLPSHGVPLYLSIVPRSTHRKKQRPFPLPTGVRNTETHYGTWTSNQNGRHCQSERHHCLPTVRQRADGSSQVREENNFPGRPSGAQERAGRWFNTDRLKLNRKWRPQRRQRTRDIWKDIDAPIRDSS